jgi:GH15 family glucan-1,4-alpha-glucosidase
VRILAVLLLLTGVARAMPPVASWSQLTTGNGFGFQVFDANAKQVTQFLERPYRYLRPGLDPHGLGVERRNLAYDVYFGLRVGSTGAWLREVAQTAAEHVDQTGIVRSAAAPVAGISAESFYWAPFGYSGNALIMVVHATNTSGAPAVVDVFANPNFHLGAASDPNAPSAVGESVAPLGSGFTETGPGGGAMVYLPIAGFDRADCSGTGYTRVKAGQDLADAPRACNADDATIVMQKSLGTLAPGQSAWWGVAIGFDADASRADAALAALTAFVAGRGADQLLADARAEWDAWRVAPPPLLTDTERRIFRQAEAELRMAQVLEPWSDAPKHKAHGMLLASLPPGVWHIGWVRDATFAIVALARLGHAAEARRALQFFLDADAGGYQAYTGAPYRVSVTRYFGDGTEESDWSADGPNVELDGWGLYLWAARTYVDASGDAAWLDAQTHAGERNYDVMSELVAAPLDANVESQSGVIAADTSIWESHWAQRKHYAFTSLAAARGLCDFAALARARGDAAAADRFAHRAGALPGAIRSHMVDGKLVLGGSQEGVAGGRYHDGAVLAGLNWALFRGDDPMVGATLDGLSALRVASGGYMRNDDALSSYDGNEWVMIDLQAARAFRAFGRATDADALLAWVTAQADVNYDVVPELYNTFASDGAIGAYTGAVPMVGFGAAQYVLALLDRAGAAPEQRDCGEAAVPDGGADGGIVAPASGCSVAPCRAGAPWLLLVVIGFAIASRRRYAGVGTELRRRGR